MRADIVLIIMVVMMISIMTMIILSLVLMSKIKYIVDEVEAIKGDQSHNVIDY